MKLFESTAHMRAIVILRLVVAPLAAWHLWGFVQADRYFGEGFYVPFFESWPVPAFGTYRFLMGIGVVAALLLWIGWKTRAAAILTLAAVSYNILANQLHFHHNRAFLMTLLFGLALLPSGAGLSVDAWRASRKDKPTGPRGHYWQLVLFRLLASTPYLASGFSKLIDPDWFGGLVMRDRIVRYRHLAEAKGVPSSLIDLVADPTLNSVIWKGVVLGELFIGVALWFRPTHTVAIFVALGFHILIEATSKVQLFSLLGICATLIWVVPEVRERRVEVPGALLSWRWTPWIKRLDWLQRFHLSGGETFRVFDWDGTEYEASAARWLVLSRLPLTAPLALPIWWHVRFRSKPPR